MLLAFFLTAILAVAEIALCTSTETTNVKSVIQTPMPLNNSTMPPILDATASKLIRYRSKPPPNFFRHKSQPNKRSRPRVIKSPKIKNNRPVYTQHFEQNLQPSNFYKFKPEIHTSTLAYKPSYTSYEEIHYEVRPESYPKKESINYETQSMDLDFYGETYPKKKVVTQYEYSKPQKTYSKPQKVVQQFEFSKPQKTYSIQQQPQKSYESPKEQSFDYSYPSKPEVHYEISYHEESPEQEYHHPAPPPSPPKQKYEEFSSYGPPPKKFHQTEQVSYQLPDNKYEPPASSYHPPELPSKEGPYQIYDKKLPNNGYKYNNDFAEPPTDIHIIHSPSYDIEPLPKHVPQQNYEKPHETYGPPPSDIYGPPHSVYGPPEYNKQSMESYHPPNSGQFAEPPGSYLPPPHLPDDLPLNKNHMPPGYDYPKSSYEVPLYDPIPFESTTAEQDFFPPNHYDGAAQHEHVSESNTHIQHIPSSPTITSTTSTKQNEEHQVQQANTKVNRFSPTNKRRFKKPNRYQTTAKVPTSSEENFLPEAPSSEFIDEVISTTSSRPRRKRKRTKAPPVAEKHNLDAPELEEAFETGRDHRDHRTDEELTAASDIKENIKSPQRPQSKIKKITEFSSTNSWNPMRIRTKQTNPQRGQRLASPPTSLNDLKNVEVISIQKSHSHSYYAGTEAPTTKRTRTMTSRADAIKMPTVSTTTTSRTENVMKPTRGGLVIDTTYFKVKGHDEDQEYYDGTGKLPKNHKMF